MKLFLSKNIEINDKELALLAIKFTTLGDMLSVIATRQAVCSKEI